MPADALTENSAWGNKQISMRKRSLLYLNFLQMSTGIGTLNTGLRQFTARTILYTAPKFHNSKETCCSNNASWRTGRELCSEKYTKKYEKGKIALLELSTNEYGAITTVYSENTNHMI